ncbi:MAG: ABC transporter substrate-binding protein, partial [bacterium]|nr:ABC transporter substrate-binding protein [bacterium]
VAEIVAYYEVKKLYTTGQVAKAKKRAEDFRKRYPRSPYHSRVKRILKGSKSQQKKNIQIGLLAPVSGDNADIGKFVVQGVQLAIDYYNKTHTPPIELVIMDTRGNMVETARKARELVRAHRVPIIIGPVLSANATVAASAYMGDPDVVMITPTATDDGIARLGKNVFQMNVTLGILGKRIARYAVENLYIKEFAIISPISEYGRILAANFKEEVLRCGGSVLVEEHFDEGMNDFRLQFENLRSKLAERKWEQMALEGRPEYGEEVRDRRAKATYLADSTIEIGGLFIPAESEDVTKIASQVYFHRIRSQLLGSNGWHSNATILSGKRYVENAVFSTNFETDMKNEKWKSFSKLFWDRFKENPDRVAAPLGYDAANLILQVLQDSDDPEFIADKLRSVTSYHGVSGLISFDNADGVNSEAAVLKISNKKFIRLQ